MSKRSRSSRARGARAEELSPQSHFRRVRSERLLLEELRRALDEAADPRLQGVKPLALELSPDGGHARIPYCVQAPRRTDERSVRLRTLAALERASGFLRASLASTLELRQVPTLGFHFVGLAEEGGEPCPE